MKLFARPSFMAVFLLIILICFPFFSEAQIGVPCDYNDPDIICPIDNGLFALLAVGVIYGIKKVRDSRRNQIN